jgi:hypothetical protein
LVRGIKGVARKKTAERPKERSLGRELDKAQKKNKLKKLKVGKMHQVRKRKIQLARASVYFAQIQRQLTIMSACTASRRNVQNVNSNGSGRVIVTEDPHVYAIVSLQEMDWRQSRGIRLFKNVSLTGSKVIASKDDQGLQL